VGGYFLFIKPDSVHKTLVPSVVGRESLTGQTILRNAGFKVGQPMTVTSRRPKGQIIAQDPLAGQKIKDGSTINLTVSGGPGQAGVPVVVGQSQRGAVALIKKAGFKAQVQMRSDDSVPRGQAIETAPAAATQLDLGSTVILYVSSGAKPVTVPDVTGEQSDAAQSELRDKGLTPRVVEFVSQTKKAGTVLSQTPAGGASVAKGSTVRITVAKEPDTATVPNVKGQQDNQAISAIQAAGFTVNLREKIVSNPDQDGKVLGQTPAGGGKLKKGGSVGIVVGRFKASPNPNEQNPGGSTGSTGATR
jgi:serine/threonine-protein kinase